MTATGEPKMVYYEQGNKRYYRADGKKMYVNGERVHGMVVKDDGNEVSIKTYKLESHGVSTLRSIGRFVGGALMFTQFVFASYGGYKIGKDITDYLITQETFQTEVSSKPSDFVYVRDNRKGDAVLRYEALSGETTQSISDFFNRTDQQNDFADTTKYNVMFANGKYVGDAPLKEAQRVYVVTDKYDS